MSTPKFLVGTAMLVSLTGIVWSQPAPAQVSPFDKDDPEIERIRALDWKNADFDKLDALAQCNALLALNRALALIGGKADARLDLLLDFVEKNDLGPEVAAAAGAAEPSTVTFEQMKKVAAAFMATPAGQQQFGKEFAEAPAEMLPRYQTLYEKSALRAFAEAAESRFQVRILAGYLEKSGRLEEFKKWSIEEKNRRQAEHQKQLAENKAADDAAPADRRAQVLAAQESNRRRLEAEQSARNMEIALQGQQEASGPNVGIDGEWSGDTWYPWTGAYYANAVYRARVRDRAQDSWQDWRGRPRPVPRRR